MSGHHPATGELTVASEDQWKNIKQSLQNEAAALDGVIAEWQAARVAAGKRLFCAAGCSNCCTLFVQSTLAEARIVAEQLDAPQFAKLEEYILRQRECFAGEDDFLTILRKQRTTLGPCPFLDDTGSCGVYALRPLACRALLSTKDPAWCAADFSNLDPLEKRLYLESLEREVVAYPVHYVASTQAAAQGTETRLLEQIQALPGGAISGNFPLLVYLAHINSHAAEEDTNWSQLFLVSTFYHPLLINLPPSTGK